MIEILEKIAKASHIVVISNQDLSIDSLASASVIYTFLLQNHKKTSWFCKNKNLDKRVLVIPWSDSIKSSFPISADLVISLGCEDSRAFGVELECEVINIDHHSSNTLYGDLNFVYIESRSTTEILYNFFKANNLKINKKIATALYAGVLDSSEAFLSSTIDGTTFAIAKELIENGADFRLCNENIIKRVSLAALRLRAIMFKNMLLKESARVALFCVSHKDMLSSGATFKDCENPLRESLNLESVEIAVLLSQKSDLSIEASIYSKKEYTSKVIFKIEDITSLKEAQDKILILIKKDL